MIAASSEAFRASLLKLDRSEQILVLKTVERILSSKAAIGKPLSAGLRGCRSIRTGSQGRLRIVFFTPSAESLKLLAVGPREDAVVYIQALQVLRELER